MDTINVLRYERWRKLNDQIIGRNAFNIDTLEQRTLAELRPMLTKDGFLKQKVIGGKSAESDQNIKINIKTMICTLDKDGKFVCLNRDYSLPEPSKPQSSRSERSAKKQVFMYTL